MDEIEKHLEKNPRWEPPSFYDEEGLKVQLGYMEAIYGSIVDVLGTVVECGIGKNDQGKPTTLAMLVSFVARENVGRKVYRYDTFRGWPAPTTIDLQSPRNPKMGEWTQRLEDIWDNLKQFKITEQFPYVELLVGQWILDEDSFGSLVPPIAFLHLDCDLEVPYRQSLAYLYPKVAKGGVILIDEYREYHPDDPDYAEGQTKWPGCDLSVDNFLASLPESSFEFCYHEASGKYYIRKLV